MHIGVLRLSQEEICGCERELRHALTKVLKLAQILESLARSLKIQSCLELLTIHFLIVHKTIIVLFKTSNKGFGVAMFEG